MNERIRELLDQMAALEAELGAELQKQEQHLTFKIKGNYIKFEHGIEAAHSKLKLGFFPWLFGNRPQNLLTGPIIYCMIVPLLLLDLCVSLYQASCFPIYRIRKVKRADYFVHDRQHLAYLNFIEKFHCSYCAYATGLIAYINEIIGRTEQYFCPIKHARKVAGTHSRYVRFLQYGDATDYQTRLESMRDELAKLK